MYLELSFVIPQQRRFQARSRSPLLRSVCCVESGSTRALRPCRLRVSLHVHFASAARCVLWRRAFGLARAPAREASPVPEVAAVARGGLRPMRIRGRRSDGVGRRALSAVTGWWWARATVRSRLSARTQQNRVPSLCGPTATDTFLSASVWPLSWCPSYSSPCISPTSLSLSLCSQDVRTAEADVGDHVQQGQFADAAAQRGESPILERTILSRGRRKTDLRCYVLSSFGRSLTPTRAAESPPKNSLVSVSISVTH